MIAFFLSLMLSSVKTGHPLTDPATWLGTDDYPRSEVSRGITGITGYNLTINKNGKVDDCIITSTSGSDALDATACALLKVRARFEPGRDSAGHKIGFVFPGRVRWQIPEGASFAMPVEPIIVTIAVDIDERGLVENCAVTEKPAGMSDTARTPCLNFPTGRQVRAFTGPDGKPQKVQMIMSNSVRYIRR